MTQRPQPGGTPPGEGREVPVHHVNRSSGVWSKRKAAAIGGVLGALFGLFFFAAYGVVAALVCSGMRECPGSWQPFAITAGVGWVVSMGLGAFVVLVFRWLYKIFKVV